MAGKPGRADSQQQVETSTEQIHRRGWIGRCPPADDSMVYTCNGILFARKKATRDWDFTGGPLVKKTPYSADSWLRS